MATQEIDVMIQAGKATAAPPLGPALGPLGVNTGAIVDEINNKTKSLDGMQVPVKVIVDTNTKEFEIEVGTPPASALIKKELGIEKGSGEAGISRVADITEEQVKKIAESKFGSAAEENISQIKGTCRSMGISVGEGEVSESEKKKATEKKEAAKPEEDAEAPKEEKPKEEPKKEAKKKREFKGK